MDGGGGQKTHAIRRGGVDFFWNNPLGKDHISCLKHLLIKQGKKSVTLRFFFILGFY